MRLRGILTLTAAGTALALGACSPRFFHHRQNYRAVSTLDCPQSEGDLTRQAAAADGKSCTYAGPDGAQVTLQVVALGGADASAALKPIEATLRSQVPAASASSDASGEGRVDIDLPGIHIHASGKDNDHDGGQVKIGRDVTITDGNTVVHDGGGAVNIDAHDKGAEIRIDESRDGIRRNFILASDTPGPSGFKVAGYDARGPRSGPLVVASMLVKSDDHDELSDDIRRLLRLNVGG
jgi:hypothetical protein